MPQESLHASMLSLGTLQAPREQLWVSPLEDERPHGGELSCPSKLKTCERAHPPTQLHVLAGMSKPRKTQKNHPVEPSLSH